MIIRSVYKIFLLIVMMLAGAAVFARQSIIDTSKQHLREKIYAHTDKDFYTTGEILWFKLYDVSADSLMPLSLSNIAYVEILNADQKPVLQATVALNNGSGNGSFYFTSSVTSGHYIFRAYTNWMKNFGADQFFQKQITVFNTLTQFAKPVNKDSGNYEIGFFPEGGLLVANMESKVGFKVTDYYGNGVNCSGQIVDENNQTIISFSTLKFGMGSFYFTPKAERTYNAVVNIQGKKITKTLPAAINKGYVMHVTGGDSNIIKVSVRSSEGNEPLYLVVYNHGNLKSTLRQAMNNGVAIFTLNKNSLSHGISRLTIFSNEKQRICERIIFLKPRSLQLKLSADKEVYDKRSAVQLNVAGNDSADLSMAVYLVDSLHAVGDNNMPNYLWFTSDLNGRVESPQYYFNSTGPEADAALDNLLLTQGWSKFTSDITTKAQPFRFAPEREGHIIEGRVVYKPSGSLAANVRVYLSVPGRHFRFATAVSNDSGKVVFDIKDFYGPGELVVQTAKEDSMYRVEIADAFSEEPGSWHIPPLNFSEDKLTLLSRHHLAMQVQNAYVINQLNRFNAPALDTNAFYGKPDAVYYLDNYVRFNTMEEVLREYIANVNVRLRQGNYSLTTLDDRNHAVFETDPLVLVDGVPVFDINKLMAYNPLKIKRADVLTRKYYINSLTANGILSYATYNGDLEGFQFEPGILELSYNGLQLEREFYSPRYAGEEAKQSRLPDYRTLLYWSPDLKGTNQPSFYTSDVKGKYIVVVQGVGKGGSVGYASTYFEVK